MAKFVQGKVVGKTVWNDKLFSLQVDAEVAAFKAGQFTRLGLTIAGEQVAHPYSYVNAPHVRPLEFYFVLVPGGVLTTQLSKLEKGDSIQVSHQAFGFLRLDQVPEARYLWLLSTGTGIGPFLSILNTDEPWQRFERVVLVHAVRYSDELTYQDSINQFSTQYGDQFRYIPFVSRTETDFALQMRIPDAIAGGQLEQQAGISLTAESSQVMLCGNPNMISDTTQALLAKGLQHNKRKSPGQISVENYW